MAVISRGAVALILFATTFSTPALADGQPSALLPQEPVLVESEPQGRERLGTTRIFTNDWFGMPVGDRYDRWRSGGYQSSVFWGHPWDGALPTRPGQIMEYRFRGEIIAPDNLSSPAAGDRLYAPLLSFGAHTHFQRNGFEFSLGADLVLTGEQTRLMDLHDAIHRTFGGSDVDLSDFMIEDGTYLHGTAEIARTFTVSDIEVRPFAELQAGVETFARAGVDLRFGTFDNQALLVREPITGQRVVGLAHEDYLGWGFVVGGDVAYIHDSVLLPASGPAAEEMRFRLRGGVNYVYGMSNFFYGVTYLSEEFVGQDEGQLVGSMSMMLRF